MSVTLATDGLGFRYRRRGSFALRHVASRFSSNSIAVLGPNGAGKSTLFGVLSTSRTASEGTFTVHDRQIAATRAERESFSRVMGYVPQRLSIFPDYTCREFLRYVAWLKRVPADKIESHVAEALMVVQLADRGDDKFKTLSGGMRQRLCLAGGLVNRPRLLLLDEPTVGLDPLQRADLLARLRGVQEHTLVVVATHLVEDVVELAEEVLVLHEGRAAFAGSLSDFCAKRREEITGADIRSSYEKALTGPGVP